MTTLGKIEPEGRESPNARMKEGRSVEAHGVAELFLLGLEILAVVLARDDGEGDLLDDLEAEAL